MKKSLVLILLFFVILSNHIYARVDNYNTYSSLNIDFKISSNISVGLSDNSKLESVIANLTLIPYEDRMQRILSLEKNSNPEASINSDPANVVYIWGKLSNLYQFGLNSEIQTENLVHKVPHVEFPIQDLNSDYERYTLPTLNIDSDQAIVQKANSLVEGVDDEFEATFKIADWVKSNIKYDLNTLTASVAQKSTWVFDKKEGVCDELTSLFISMLRSVGIPAIFVTGMVYTNLDYDFGNHGWAEVYFPGYGWVPFDVTLGQYGWIDPSHIKLSDSLDSAEPSVKYSWKAFNVDLKPQDLLLKSFVKGIGSKVEPKYPIQLTLLENKVNANSYIPLKVTVENPFDYYISTTLLVTKAPELLQSNTRQIMLKPKEKRDFFWIIKTPTNLEAGYIYKAQIEVMDTFNSVATGSLEYSLDYDHVTLDKAQSEISDLEVRESKTYSKLLSLECNLSKLYYFTDELVNVLCSAKNKGNTFINNLEVCLLADCKNIDLSISENKILNFSFYSNFTKKTIEINAKNEDIEVSNFLALKIYKTPDLKIVNPNFESELDYNENFNISFFLISEVFVRDLVININKQKFIQVGYLDTTKEVTIPLKAKNFINKPIIIEIDYKDERNKYYKTTATYFVDVNNVPWYAKIIVFFKKLI